MAPTVINNILNEIAGLENELKTIQTMIDNYTHENPFGANDSEYTEMINEEYDILTKIEELQDEIEELQSIDNNYHPICESDWK